MSSALAVDRSSSASMVFIFLAIVSYLFSDSVSVYWASFSCCSSPSMLSTLYRCHHVVVMGKLEFSNNHACTLIFIILYNPYNPLMEM